MSLREYPTYTFETESTAEAEAWGNALLEQTAGVTQRPAAVERLGSGEAGVDRVRLQLRGFGPIGIVFAERVPRATIAAIAPGSLAERAGRGALRPGMELVAVGGADVRGWQTSRALTKLQAEKRT